LKTYNQFTINFKGKGGKGKNENKGKRNQRKREDGSNEMCTKNYLSTVLIILTF
jgi:hypothetical protein